MRRLASRQREEGEQRVAHGARLTVGYLGVMMMLIGLILFVPLLALPFWPDEQGYAWCFVVPGAITFGLGALANSLIHGWKKGPLERGQDAVVLVLTWVIATVALSTPFMLACHLSFSEAIFETISGLSTTTFTLLTPEQVPDVVLLHRSLLLYFGGIGLVLVMVSALSDSHGMRIYVTEGHTDRLLPNLKRSAQLIMGIYTMLILIGTLCYVALDMPVFDSLIHAIGAVCTGGFSTHSDSVAFFESVPVEAVTIILMILGGTNCALHMLLLTGRWREFGRDVETRMYFATLVGATLLVTCVLFGQGAYGTLPEAFRQAIFQTVSAITTTGFTSTTQYVTWPAAARMLLILGMIVGSESESTGGGIKQWRIGALAKMVWWEVRDTVTNRRCVHGDMIEHLGHRRRLGVDEQQDILVFSIVYLLTLVAGAFAYELCGFSIPDSLFESASALATAGISCGIATQGASLPVLWISIILMFVGRLEIYPVLTAIARSRLIMRGRRN